MHIEVAGRRVLVDGLAPRTGAEVHRLLAEGARVTVATGAAGPPPATVQDLADRGLIELVTAADRTDFDVVLTVEPGPAPADNDSDRGTGPGQVILVGGGPGDPGLLTVAGALAVREADVIVYDRLAPVSVLADARPDALTVDVGKIPRGASTAQERINALLVEHATAGRRVVRLKGGDGFVFGRGAEEALACAAAGVPVRVIPGVTSATAAPTLAGIPVTHRSLTQGFTVVSGHAGPGSAANTLDWAALARANTTLIVLMGVATLPAICATLRREGLPGHTPAAVVADAGLPSMRTVRGTLADIAGRSAAAGVGSPAVTVIGAVAAMALDTVDA